MSVFRNIPKVDKLLSDPAFTTLKEENPAKPLLLAVRTVLEKIRGELAAGSHEPASLAAPVIAGRVAAELKSAGTPSLRRVINATGIVIHTNLGRSPLPEKIWQQVTDVALNYSTLEFDCRTGQRGDRYVHVEPLICELTGAEAAVVVNNNAAALLLALSSVAKGGEVIVSRGELVEIGGSFRIPDIMAQSGATLREVGTTNRTHLKDYSNALAPETSLLLKVCCSNFAMVGYTAEVTPQELAGLGKAAGIPLMVDAGSGLFIDLEPLTGSQETTVRNYIAAGADIVVCSGDKLLGGPQAGIIAGRSQLIEPMKKHPLLRALRPDKLTLSALEGVLRLYRDERSAIREIPALRLLSLPAKELQLHTARILRVLQRNLPDSVKPELVNGFSTAGGGTLPLLRLPTKLIALRCGVLPATVLEKAFRAADTPVIGRIAKDLFLLDPRTILPSDIGLLETSLKSVVLDNNSHP